MAGIFALPGPPQPAVGVGTYLGLLERENVLEVGHELRLCDRIYAGGELDPLEDEFPALLDSISNSRNRSIYLPRTFSFTIASISPALMNAWGMCIANPMSPTRALRKAS